MLEIISDSNQNLKNIQNFLNFTMFFFWLPLGEYLVLLCKTQGTSSHRSLHRKCCTGGYRRTFCAYHVEVGARYGKPYGKILRRVLNRNVSIFFDIVSVMRDNRYQNLNIFKSVQQFCQHNFEFKSTISMVQIEKQKVRKNKL